MKRVLFLVCMCVSTFTLAQVNCEVDFAGTGSTNYSQVCAAGSNAGNLSLGVNYLLDDGDVFTFDTPSEITINGNLNIKASGNGKIIIPEGVTVNVLNNVNLDAGDGGCQNAEFCSLQFVVYGTLNIAKNIENHVSTTVWSGSGTVQVNKNLNNTNNGCMECGASCPAFPSAGGAKCNDDGSCGTNFCSNGNYGNDDPITMIADAGPDQVLCGESEAKLEASEDGGPGQWTTENTSITIESPNDPHSIITGLRPGEYALTWTNAYGSDDVNITIVSIPEKPTIDFEIGTLCIYSLTASEAPNGGSYIWYRDGVEINRSGRTITAYASGKYTVEIEDGNEPHCISNPSDALQVNALTRPSKPVITYNTLSACEGNNIILTIEEVPKSTYRWEKDGKAMLELQNSNTVTLSSIEESGSYTVIVVNDISCWSPESDPVGVTISTKPSRAETEADKTICDANTTSINAVEPRVGTGKWSIVSGEGQISNEYSNATFITGLLKNSETVVRWTVTNGACVDTDDLKITSSVSPLSTDAGDDQVLCNASNSRLNAEEPLYGTGKWEIISGNASISDVSDPKSIINSIMPGTELVLSWRVTTACGFSESQVKITSLLPADEANAGEDIFLCDNYSTQLAATGVGGHWEVLSGSGTLNDSHKPNATVEGLSLGENKLQWVIDGEACDSSVDEIIIYVSPKPSTANAGADQVICNGQETVQLSASVPSQGSRGKWSFIEGGGNIEDENAASTSVNALRNGINVLRWTVSNSGSCEPSYDDVVIEFYETPGVTSSEEVICAGEAAKLEAYGGSNYVWSPAETLEEASSDRPVAKPINDTNYSVKIMRGSCEPKTFTVSVQVIPLPNINVNSDATIQLGSSIQLQASGAEHYSWSPAGSLNNAQISNPVATPENTTTYTVTGNNGSACEGEAKVTINVEDYYEVFVPQMFTPNNDEHNDILLVNTIGISELEFKVYNRRGKEVFASSNTEIGWDGTVDGKEQMADTYVYFVRAVTIRGEVISKKGSVQLVR